MRLLMHEMHGWAPGAACVLLKRVEYYPKTLRKIPYVKCRVDFAAA